MTKDVLLAAIIGAHGLKGEVKLKLFSDDIGRYRDLHAKDGRVFTLTRARGDVAAFVEIPDRNTAEQLKGVELFVMRGDLPVPGGNEFYHADLIGLAAMDTEDRTIGTVKAIHNYGAGDVIEIARADGDTAMFPFARDFVPLVDIAGGRVVIAVPEEVETGERGNVE